MKDIKKPIKINIIPILIIGFLTAFDQLTKFMITSSFELYESRTVVKKLLAFTYIQNRGVAWGMFQGKRIIFLIITAIILVLCFYIYSNIANKPKYRILRANMILLISGALGNMIDRIELGYVVDFFEFKFIDFPVFNVADIYVVISMIMIFILIMFKYSNDEFDEIIGCVKQLPDAESVKNNIIEDSKKHFDEASDKNQDEDSDEEDDKNSNEASKDKENNLI